MDYGHTFSPYLESATRHELSHGEAVAVDMAFSAALARELGWIDDAQTVRLVEILRALGLPLRHELLDPATCSACLDEAEQHRGGAVNLHLPTGFGEVDCVRERELLTPEVLAGALQRLEAIVGREPGSHRG